MKTRYLKTLVVAVVALVASAAFAQYKITFGSGGDNPVQMCLATNFFVRAGLSDSNGVVSGTVWKSTSAVANPTSNGTPATVASVTVPASSMLNVGDAFTLRAFGRMPAAEANTNEFVVKLDTQTVLDTGLQTASNTVYNIEARAVMIDSLTVRVFARCEWGPGGGVPFVVTNSVADYAVTNSLDNAFALLSTARRQGSHTNLFASVTYEPASKSP